MPISKINDQAIDQLCAEHKANYGGVRNDYFAPLFLVREHEIEIDQALLQTTFGGKDYGFDAFHLDKKNWNLYLYQFKWTDDASAFKESYLRMLDVGMNRLFEGSFQDSKQNQAILQIKSLLFENKKAVDNVFIRFVFKGEPVAADNSTALSKLQEDLEAKKYLVDKFFGRQVNLVIDYRSVRGHIGGRSVSTKTHVYEIGLGALVQKLGPAGECINISSVRLFQLNSMLEEMGQRFFDRNIRSGLTGDEAPNRAIGKSLRDIVLEEKVAPEVFFFYHNGVTLYAQNLEHLDGSWRITEPRVLNGAQTITTFNSFMKKYHDHPKLKTNRARLEDIEVLCRIVTNASDDFVISVTVNNNRQNPVRPWALRANDLIQLELADKFRDDLGIYYERQENAFHNLTDDELEQMDIVQQKAIELRRLATTLLIADGEIDRASRLPYVFEDDKQYAHVFSKTRLTADTRKIVLCYKVQYRIQKLIEEIVSKGYKKYFFARRARNLIWALVVQGMLNDDDIDDYAEDYGRSMSIEAGFTEWLRGLAGNKVKLLLGNLIEDRSYEQKIADERYDFLRTKAAFEHCMQSAYKKWKWVKQPLK